MKICSECIEMRQGDGRYWCPWLNKDVDPAQKGCFFFSRLKADDPESDAPGQTFLGICQGASLYE